MFVVLFFGFVAKMACGTVIPRQSISIQTSSLGILPWLPEASMDTQTVFTSAVFGQLLKYDEYMQIQSGIFTDFNWNKDDYTYHFKFDPNAKYHNGLSIDPVDIEFAIAKLFLTKRRIVRKEVFSDIVGIDNLKEGQPFVAGMISGITYDNQGNFYIKLKRINTRFLYSIANSVPGIAPRNLFKSDMFSFKQLPIGLGKYKVVSVDKSKAIIDLERLDKSNCVKSNPCPLYIKFIESGNPSHNKVDIAAFTSARDVEDNDNYTLFISSLPTSVTTIDFNFTNYISVKKNFREAISLSLNRDDIFKGYKTHKPSHQIVTSHTVGGISNKFKYNPTLAREIVGKEFKDIIIDGWYHGQVGLEVPHYVEEIRKQLANVGIKINFAPTLKQGMDSVRVGMFVYSMSLDYSNPILPLAINMDSDVRTRHLPRDRNFMNQLYETIKISKNPEDEARNVGKMLKYIMKNFIQIPIAQGYKIMAIKKGIDYPQSGYFAYTIDFDKLLIK
jgi:ABC-type transport system substrate-binding protein